MSRDYGKIKTTFWTWAARKKLSQNARMMAMYLLSGPHSSAIGVYYLPDGYISSDLGMDTETVCHTLSELSRKGFVYRCLETDFVFITSFIEHNPPENMNVGKMMQKLINQIPSDFAYWSEFIDVLKPYDKRFEKGFIKGLSNGMPTPEPEPEPEPIEKKASLKKSEAEKRGSKIPEDWTPGEAGKQFAFDQGLNAQEIKHEFARFRDYWIAKPGQAGRKSDWDATWRNWIRKRADDNANHAKRRSGRNQPGFDGFLEAAEEHCHGNNS